MHIYIYMYQEKKETKTELREASLDVSSAFENDVPLDIWKEPFSCARMCPTARWRSARIHSPPVPSRTWRCGERMGKMYLHMWIYTYTFMHMYTCSYACIQCSSVPSNPSRYGERARTQRNHSRYIYMNIHLYLFQNVYIYAYIHIYIYIYIDTYMHMYIYIHMNIHTGIYVCMAIHSVCSV